MTSASLNIYIVNFQTPQLAMRQARRSIVACIKDDIMLISGTLTLDLACAGPMIQESSSRFDLRMNLWGGLTNNERCFKPDSCGRVIHTSSQTGLSLGSYVVNVVLRLK